MSLPFHTKATTWDFPKHPLFTLSSRKRELVHLFGISRYQAIQSQEKHLPGWHPWKPRRSTQSSCMLRVSLCRAQHIPAVLASQPACCSRVPDPRQTSQSCAASGMCRTNSHCTDVCHGLDTLACATCTSTHSVVWNTGAIGTQLELGVDKWHQECSQICLHMFPVKLQYSALHRGN